METNEKGNIYAFRKALSGSPGSNCLLPSASTSSAQLSLSFSE